MIYNVLDICYYIIEYSYEKEDCINNLKLQKLLYFVQAWFLINTNEPCFFQDIEAWDFGAVVPEIYSKFSKFGCGTLPFYKCSIEIFEDDKFLINSVISKFLNWTSTDMLKLIHHQKPWIDAYYNEASNIITNESLLDYFHA